MVALLLRMVRDLILIGTLVYANEHTNSLTENTLVSLSLPLMDNCRLFIQIPLNDNLSGRNVLLL